MEEFTLAADVYEVGEAISGVNHDYLWDFGTFVCEGTESHPVVQSNPYTHTVCEQDTEWLEHREVERKSVTLYEWDYGVYIPLPEDFERTLASNVWYLIDGYPYELQHEVELRGADGTNCVLLSRRGDEILVTKEEFQSKIEQGEWRRLLHLR